MVLETLKEHQTIDRERAIRLWPGLDYQPRLEENWGLELQQPDWILKAHNTRSGRIFIMGTGPSLAKQAHLMPHLDKEQTWTVNRMARWAPPFTPTHHSIAEPGPVCHWGRRIDPQFDFPTALNRIAIHWFPVAAPGWLWVAKAHDDVQMRWEGFFGLGPVLPPLPTGWASPLTSAQVAAWLGYTEFYFLGMDTTQGGQAWDPVGGTTRQPRSIITILECFERATHQIKKAGRKIYDCTPGGRVNQEGILEYVPLEEALAGGIGANIPG